MRLMRRLHLNGYEKHIELRWSDRRTRESRMLHQPRHRLILGGPITRNKTSASHLIVDKYLSTLVLLIAVGKRRHHAVDITARSGKVEGVENSEQLKGA